jgi:hypothetical protein
MKLLFINALVIEQNGNKVIKQNKAFLLYVSLNTAKLN